MEGASFGYLGSKYSLLNFIEENILKNNAHKKSGAIFCDLFAGTGIVGYYFKNKGFNIKSNEIESYGFCAINSLIKYSGTPKFTKLGGQKKVFKILDQQKHKGFMYKNYAPSSNNQYKRKYFTIENALKIDGIRKWIKDNFVKHNISQKEKEYLLYCLIRAVSKVANTASVYEAFLKKFKNSAIKKLELKPIAINKNNPYQKNFTYNQDAGTLIKRVKGDILYLDPPFNSRQYASNYHILKTIVQNDNPKIKPGITGNRCDNYSSKWCIKNNATKELEKIIKLAKFKEIYFSYNCDGIIPPMTIEKIFKKYGELKIYKKIHQRFKAGIRDYKKKSSVVYLYCCIKESL